MLCRRHQEWLKWVIHQCHSQEQQWKLTTLVMPVLLLCHTQSVSFPAWLQVSWWNASLVWFFIYIVFLAEVLKHRISENSMACAEAAATLLKDGAFSKSRDEKCKKSFCCCKPDRYWKLSCTCVSLMNHSFQSFFWGRLSAVMKLLGMESYIPRPAEKGTRHKIQK